MGPSCVKPAPRSDRSCTVERGATDGLAKFDNSAILPDIACSTLVVGGEQDSIISTDLQRAMARLIPNSRLVLYAGYGHAAPVEHPGYEGLTRRFMEEILRGPETVRERHE
jgi:pimeloyl-ACP methyl ester carboxylesterase